MEANNWRNEEYRQKIVNKMYSLCSPWGFFYLSECGYFNVDLGLLIEDSLGHLNQSIDNLVTIVEF
jgi:hypothetical protein